jgi:hypothetical protein
MAGHPEHLRSPADPPGHPDIEDGKRDRQPAPVFDYAQEIGVFGRFIIAAVPRESLGVGEQRG